MSAATCFYHPDQIASTTCAQCAVPLCDQCAEIVADKSVCRRCVSAIRARLASQMTPPPLSAAAPSGTVLPQAARSTPSAHTNSGFNLVGLLLGFVYGAVIGVIGAFLLAQIELASGYEIGLLNSLVGFGVGFGVLMGYKRGGLLPAVIGGILAFFSMVLCAYLFFLNTSASHRMEFLDYLMRPSLDWLFIAIGVYGGAKTPLRAGR